MAGSGEGFVHAGSNAINLASSGERSQVKGMERRGVRGMLKMHGKSKELVRKLHVRSIMFAAWVMA